MKAKKALRDGCAKRKNKKKQTRRKRIKNRRRKACKKGKGLEKRRKNNFEERVKIIKNIPNRPMTNNDIVKYAALLNIPYFRGVFMRDLLPTKIHENESGIVNLDSISGLGTHWVCYVKRGFDVEYFDSFGNLKPPLELQRYFNSGPYQASVRYNYFAKQQPGSVRCGHLCLQFLAERK